MTSYKCVQYAYLLPTLKANFKLKNVHFPLAASIHIGLEDPPSIFTTQTTFVSPFLSANALHYSGMELLVISKISCFHSGEYLGVYQIPAQKPVRKNRIFLGHIVNLVLFP